MYGRKTRKTKFYNPIEENLKPQLKSNLKSEITLILTDKKYSHRNKKNRCSYCKKLGHNIKTCELKKNLYYAEILIMIKKA